MAIDNKRDGYFSTKNTALAAYFYSEGFPLSDVEINEHPTHPGYTIATFIFESSDKLLDCNKLFQVAKANGNLVLFHEAYRKCLKMTKVGKL